jgi:hypothetical protein
MSFAKCLVLALSVVASVNALDIPSSSSTRAAEPTTTRAPQPTTTRAAPTTSNTRRPTTTAQPPATTSSSNSGGRGSAPGGFLDGTQSGEGSIYNGMFSALLHSV